MGWRQICESLVGSQASPSFREVPGTSGEAPRTSPEVFGDFPGSSLTVELNSNPEVPRKFKKLPRKFPKLPRKFSGGQPLSLGSLTPSPDSQKLSLNGGRKLGDPKTTTKMGMRMRLLSSPAPLSRLSPLLRLVWPFTEWKACPKQKPQENEKGNRKWPQARNGQYRALGRCPEHISCCKWQLRVVVECACEGGGKSCWNRVWGRGCDEAEISEEKRLFTESLEGIQ